jgi:hypothetical protein
MKKKIFGGIAVLAITAVAVVNVNLGAKSNDLSDVSLANIEALASGESGTGNTGPAEVRDCAGRGTGSKKICMCRNAYSCTETDCF